MNILQKIKSLGGDSALRNAYLRWLYAKLTLKGTPDVISRAANVRLNGWLSFSEYWTFQVAVSDSECRFIKERLRKSGSHPIAFDIGANIGAFTCHLAALGAETVHAFEPIPETFCRLKANVKLNGLLERCELNCLAVGNESGLVTFRMQPDSPATNQLALSEHRHREENCEILQRVAVASLDEYCLVVGIEHIDILKVDVEGMEPYVLRGARTLLRERKIASILIEICPVNLRSVGLSPAELYQEFEIARYSPYALNEDGRPGAKLSLSQIEAMSLSNVILLPDV